MKSDKQQNYGAFEFFPLYDAGFRQLFRFLFICRKIDSDSNGFFTLAFLSAPKNRWRYFSLKSVPVCAKVSPKILECPVALFHWDEIPSNLERKSQSGFTFRLRGLGPESRNKNRFDVFCSKLKQTILFFLTEAWKIWHTVPLVEQNHCSLSDIEALQVGFWRIQLRAW